MLLSDAKIRNATPKQNSYRLNDGEGLFLIVRPSGGKHWQFRYRFLNKEKTLSLGKYPLVTLLEARERKSDSLRLIADGTDPSNQRKRDKLTALHREKVTFQLVAKEWHEMNVGTWSQGHAAETWGRLKNHILPSIGSMAIAEIEPLELLAVIRKIEATGATHMSHRVLQICGAVYNYAIITGRTQHNITIGLSKALKPHRQQHFPTLSAHELPGFFRAFADLVTSEQNRLAFKLLLLTALRQGELRYARWVDVDFVMREWRIPAGNTKMRTEHIVPLSWQAVSLLGYLRSLTGGSEWLFPSQCGYRHEVMSENTVNQMIHRMGYKGRIVGHGFRSLFSTVLNEHGFNRDAIERQLAHMERDSVRAAYNRAEYLDARRELMQWWADFLDRQMTVETSPRFPASGQLGRYRSDASTRREIAAYPGGEGWVLGSGRL